jgi:hypothetical protein
LEKLFVRNFRLECGGLVKTGKQMNGLKTPGFEVQDVMDPSPHAARINISEHAAPDGVERLNIPLLASGAT